MDNQLRKYCSTSFTNYMQPAQARGWWVGLDIQPERVVLCANHLALGSQQFTFGIPVTWTALSEYEAWLSQCAFSLLTSLNRVQLNQLQAHLSRLSTLPSRVN